jgi:phosphoribosylglycinamide formyltransferase-1
VTEEEYRTPSPLVTLPARLGVLLSGRGSNFLALADACDRGEIPAAIAAVVSDHESAPGIAHARARGFPAFAIERHLGEDRAGYESRLVEPLGQQGVDLICLAGFMRLLSAEFLERFCLRVLNVHPSLLPAFPGKDAQARALSHGVKVTGATVHFVDAGVDTGPIVDQEPVQVIAGDGVVSLSARILEAEHRLYPRAVAAILRGGWVLSGRVVESLRL